MGGRRGGGWVGRGGGRVLGTSVRGPAKPHFFLWCNTYLMAVQLTFELELGRPKNYKNTRCKVNANGL